MRFELDLSRVCVETAAKQSYNRQLSRYFKSTTAEQASLEPVIELLVRFIKEADFVQLRHKFAALRGGSQSRIEIEAVGDVLVIYCDQAELTRCSNLNS